MTEVDDDNTTSKINIFVLLDDAAVLDSSSKVVSVLYKIVLDSDILQHSTLSPTIAAAIETVPKPKFTHSTSASALLENCTLRKPLYLPMIRPVFTFSCNDRCYPYGMSCVNVGSILYFMGGSILYTTTCLSLDAYMDFEVFGTRPTTEPITYFQDTLSCYPPDVYAFDCISSKLLDSSSPSWIPPMISGKPQHPMTFVVDNQIYVLSSQNGLEEMTHFETYNPSSKKWEKLLLPDKHFFSQLKVTVCGSALVDRRFFVTFTSGTDFSFLWYDVDSGSWTHCTSPYQLNISRDSVFVDNTLYAFHDHYMMSLGLSDTLSATTSTDRAHQYALFDKLNNNCTCTSSIQNWPLFVNQCRNCDCRLFHLGGLLKGTTRNSRCFGLVELFKTDQDIYEFKDYMPPCELRFIVLEALDGQSINSRFSAKTIHACHFSPDLSSSCVLSAAAPCAFTS